LAILWIHVPTGGTTLTSDEFRELLNFNPRAHGGHDKYRDDVAAAREFQSTCPRGARHHR